MRARIFTVAEANCLIPDLQRILHKIAEEQLRLQEGRDLLFEMSEGGSTDHRERIRLSREVEMAEHEILNGFAEIEDKGCVVKKGGLVDFFTVKNGVLYELCWRSGEKEIRFYHEYCSGFSGRLPLTAEDIALMGAGLESHADSNLKV